MDRPKQGDLAKAILETQEEERARIAYDLENNFNQVLASIKLCLEHALENPQERELVIGESIKNLNGLISEVRRLSTELSPDNEIVFGLVEAIEGLLGKAQTFNNLKVRFDRREFTEDEIAYDKKVLIFRIIKEQVDNVIRHANAKMLYVSIKKAAGIIYISVSDNGGGILYSESLEGLGLKRLRNTIQALGGNMGIMSAPGNGFMLSVQFFN